MIDKLNELVTKSEIKDWIQEKSKDVILPIFTSLDFRNSGYKLAHVDANLFPAGFNNLSENAKQRASAEFKIYMMQHFPNAKKLLLIPENFTRNLKYLESLLSLKEILKAAEYQVVIASPHIEAEMQFEQPNHFAMQALKLNNGRIITSRNWEPDLIILNNDLTSGIPEILNNIKQPILPTPSLGWHRRRKHKHFMAYNQIASDFAASFDFDPWFISTLFETCGMINFREKKGITCLAKSVDIIITKTKEKYRQYGIKDQPYVFIKADMGTYGLGVMTAHSGEEMLAINKKHRHSMDVIKQGVHNSEIMIQEGILTIEKNGEFPAESMLYMVGGKVIGNITRWNVNHDEKANLNSRGMALSASKFDEYNLRTVIAELAALAVTREEEQL